jgi:NAD(P)-dependent dehydrogenase (short-subunit alcohol dehydrogenase family)
MTKFGRSTTAIQAIEGHDLTGRTALVTGGNSGIGVETVRALAFAGAQVILCSRSVKAGEEVVQEILADKERPVKGTITIRQLDLADFASIKALAKSLAQDFPKIDLLILNAGIMACPLSRTKQGFEQQIGVNHIGHFYLTKLLLPSLKAAGTPDNPSRLVVVSSLAHTFGAIDLEDLNYEKTRKYGAWSSYGQSKLANILFTKEFARRMEEEKVDILAYTLHPGSILTNLQRHLVVGAAATVVHFLTPFLRLITRNVEQGAATSITAATAKDLPNGCYMSACQVDTPTKAGRDMDMAKKLWEKTEELVKEAEAKL